MNEDDSILASIWEDDDIITITSDDTISVTDYTYTSPLTTSLTGGYNYTASLGTASAVTTGTSGATLSTTNTGSLMWNNPTYTATAAPTISVGGAGGGGGNWLGNVTVNNTQPSLRVAGDAHFDGDINIKGVKLGDRLDAIEERLGILRPNNDLEGKWEKLKELGEEYRKLEKEILEKENMWDILKK